MFDGNDTDGLWSVFHKLMKGEREGTYSVEKIYQPSQLRSLQIFQIPFVPIMAK